MAKKTPSLETLRKRLKKVADEAAAPRSMDVFGNPRLYANEYESDWY